MVVQQEGIKITDRPAWVTVSLPPLYCHSCLAFFLSSFLVPASDLRLSSLCERSIAASLAAALRLLDADDFERFVLSLVACSGATCGCVTVWGLRAKGGSERGRALLF
jgi:hypothetical protein